LRYHVTSGDTDQVTEKLDKGLLDFAVLAQEPDSSKYAYLEFPATDRWGLIMRKDDPLARKERLVAEDLIGLPLFCSEQSWEHDIPRWADSTMDRLELEGSFQLSYNGAIFALEGLGYLLTFDKLVNTGADSDLVFRPLHPPLETHLYLIWKRQPVFTPIAERFLEQVRTSFTRT
jgi:DNA-binding transcriptional LysR family regulator